jgi:hypothetical protein
VVMGVFKLLVTPGLAESQRVADSVSSGAMAARA